MSDTGIKLRNPPIVEAVLDIDCDMPAGFDIQVMEGAAREAFEKEYPILGTAHLQTHSIGSQGDAEFRLSSQQFIRAYQFRTTDGLQLVQVRDVGYSFNRLKPYTRLDDYLPEIRRTWTAYVGLTAPVLVREIRLRYINSIPLPNTEESIELDDYLTIGPRLPDTGQLIFTGFLDQHMLRDKVTDNKSATVVTVQPDADGLKHLIFDNSASCEVSVPPEDWPLIADKIASLRALKNLIFEKSLTAGCLEKFQ